MIWWLKIKTGCRFRNAARYFMLAAFAVLLVGGTATLYAEPSRTRALRRVENDIGKPEDSSKHDDRLSDLEATLQSRIEQATLHDPSEQALQGFYRALSRAKSGEGQARILVYGASHVECDHYVGYLRDALQKRFGDAGHGFVKAAWPSKENPYWQWGVQVRRGTGWMPLRLGRDRTRPDYYGLTGVVFEAHERGAVAEVQTSDWGVGQRASALSAWFQYQPGGGVLEMHIDGTLVRKISTASKRSRAGYFTVRLKDGPHRIQLRARRGQSVRLYGATLERDTPGVIVDNVALGGSKIHQQLKWLDPVYSSHLQHRKPDLVIVAYGGNEANDFEVPLNTYARRAYTVVKRIKRVLPNASCLVVGPLDKPLLRQSGSGQEHWAHRARTTSIARIQRTLAEDLGCAFFDGISLMGGRLSMLDWVQNDPPLARPDHVHLSARGYRLLGQALLTALLKGHRGAAQRE